MALKTDTVVALATLIPFGLFVWIVSMLDGWWQFAFCATAMGGALGYQVWWRLKHGYWQTQSDIWDEWENR